MYFRRSFSTLAVLINQLSKVTHLLRSVFKLMKLGLFERDEEKIIVLEIDFLFQTIPSGLDYGDSGHFWPPRGPLGPWRVYVGFRWAYETKFTNLHMGLFLALRCHFLDITYF